MRAAFLVLVAFVWVMAPPARGQSADSLEEGAPAHDQAAGSPDGVSDVATPLISDHEDQDVRGVVQREMSRPEYRYLTWRPKPQPEREPPGWLKRFVEWLSRHSGSIDVAPEALRGLMRLAVYVLVAAVVALILVVVLKSRANLPPGQGMAGGGGEGEIEVDVPPGEAPSDEYAFRARELAGRGEYRAAIRQLLLGTMSWAERGGLIRYRRGLTNRDYVRAVARRRPGAGREMAGIVATFEPIYYGRRPATADAYAACLNHYLTGLGDASDTPPMES